MSVQEVEQRVIEIRELQDDDEAAHAEEDRLYYDVVGFIAFECDDMELARDLAAAAFGTREISFARWCA